MCDLIEKVQNTYVSLLTVHCLCYYYDDVNSPDVPRRERALSARARVPERLGPHQRVTAAAAAPTHRCLSPPLCAQISTCIVLL